MLQTTTTKRPPSLTLSGARIFKQRLATIRKHCIGSQEPGARVQWTKFSWKYDFPTFSEISLLLLYANKNFRIPNLLATLFRPWLKMSPFRFKLGDRSRFAFVFRKEIFFSILVARQITAKWSRILVQTSSKRQIKRETRPDWLATRIPFCFSIRVSSPGKWPNCVQTPYPAGTRFDCHKHWIFFSNNRFHMFNTLPTFPQEILQL